MIGWLLLLLGVVVVAVVVPAVSVTRTGSEGKPTPVAARRTRPRPEPTPLERLGRDRSDSRKHRTATCLRIGDAARLPLDSRPADDEFPGFVTMAADLWRGEDFTLRARAVGWSWLPFIDKPEHTETTEIIRERLNRNYRLGDDQRAAVDIMLRKQAGRIAFTAAQVCDRIHRTPVWEEQFFDRHHVRVDLVAEVTYLTDAARTLAEHERLLGPAPVGARAEDPDIVGVFIEKSRVLDQRTDALLARLAALDEYRRIMDQIQQRWEKQRWLDKVGAIDDLETAAQSVADHLHADALRDTAGRSDAWATVYLTDLEPLTARLTAAGKSATRPVSGGTVP